MINIAKEIQDKGFILIKKLFSKKQVNSLFQSYEENIDYCYSVIKQKVYKDSLDKKYLFLQKKNNILKSRSYDISKYDPAIYKFSTTKKLENILKNYFQEKYFLDLPQIRIDDKSNNHMLPCIKKFMGRCQASF